MNDSTTRATTPDWARLKRDVLLRIDMLAAVDKVSPPELHERLWADLVLPNVRLLAEFCSNIEVDDA